MPKKEYGDYNQIEDGLYPAIITEVISLGHQYNNKNVPERKYWINLDLIGTGQTKAVSNFGIRSWLSPQKFPYVGMYELIAAVLKTETPSAEELKSFCVYDLVGKEILVAVGQVNGYSNVVEIFPYLGEEKLKTTQDLIALDIDEAMAPETLISLSPKAADMIHKSKEYLDLHHAPDNDPSYDPFASAPDAIQSVADDKVWDKDQVPY